MTAARAQEAQGNIVAAESERVQQLMRASRALEKAALEHSGVAARWDSAATLEMKEAGAYGRVAQEVCQAHQLAANTHTHNTHKHKHTTHIQHTHKHTHTGEPRA